MDGGVIRLWPPASAADQAQVCIAGFAASCELARGTCAFDQAAPPLVPTVLPDYLAPARQRPVTSPVGQRPLPRLPPQIPTRTIPTAWPLLTRARLGQMLPRILNVPVAPSRLENLAPGLSKLSPAAAEDLAHQQLICRDEVHRPASTTAWRGRLEGLQLRLAGRPAAEARRHQQSVIGVPGWTRRADLRG